MSFHFKPVAAESRIALIGVFTELLSSIFEKLAREYGAMKVLYNGPRYWVVNSIEAKGNTRNGKIANFGGIEMTQRATLEKTIFERGLGASAYTENTVARATVYTYLKGNMVYELISPNGEIYRMQSYSQTIDKDLKIDDLEKLGNALKLPKDGNTKQEY